MTAAQKRKVKAIRDLIGRPPIKLAVLSLVIASSSFAGDDRLGVATHFDQFWNPDTAMPRISSLGASWIRDDIGWPGFEKQKGVYALSAKTIHWLTLAAQNGLKVVACFQYSNSIYADPYDPAAYAAGAGQLAKALIPYTAVKAIELWNEPNNVSADGGFTVWYPKLFNGAYAAIKATNPNMKVIGVGGQGDTNFTVYSQLAGIDGFTYHPYPPPNITPEFTYEPPYGEYLSYRKAILDPTKRTAGANQTPVTVSSWETEFGIGAAAGISDYEQALFHVRRLLISLGTGVAHTFIYAFQDESPEDGNSYYVKSGITFANNDPKQAYWGVKNVISLINGLPGQATNIVGVNPQYSDAAFDYANFYGYFFHNPTGGPSVACAWFGNFYPVYWGGETFKGRLNWTHPNTQKVLAFDPIANTSWDLAGQWVQWQNQVILLSVPVSTHPVIYVAQ